MTRWPRFRHRWTDFELWVEGAKLGPRGETLSLMQTTHLTLTPPPRTVYQAVTHSEVSRALHVLLTEVRPVPKRWWRSREGWIAWLRGPQPFWREARVLKATLWVRNDPNEISRVAFFVHPYTTAPGVVANWHPERLGRNV